LIDALIYIGFIFIVILTWKHFCKKFLSDEGLKWHAYMVSANLSLFISVSYLIVAFEIQNWAEGKNLDPKHNEIVARPKLDSLECSPEKDTSLQSLFLQLQSFKGDKAFADKGFYAEPYQTWYEEIQCLQHDRSSPDQVIIASDILQLGMEYKNSRGIENDFTRRKLEFIKKYLDESLNHSKGSRRRKL
jgi:hypothetical protein